MHGHSACFGSCSKSSDVASVDQALSSSNELDVLKGLKTSQGFPSGKQHPITETLDAQVRPSGVNENYGLVLWTEQRKQWTQRINQSRLTKTRGSIISRSATYEELLSTSHPFQKPIPLSEMVNFLVQVWEQEGLYDLPDL
ncbi:hypothetical protein KP509_05G022300 [Ceratopteris richardii]|uniref:Gag1-like clamp domain-containing protein n=1 Tax=Ceratopteris richardii TaxID=49495 RepID=A0A8T2UM37_CERRI|nr:hypothetical protein KP509_05G022300 [Ceratopteris richardii]